LGGVVLSWRDDQSLQVRGAFRGFEILSRGRGGSLMISSEDERLPELFVRGAVMYKAQFNAENPLGTMQSIEYALRGLDKALADERERAARAEKALRDFEEQAGKPFEHEARLKELLGRQTELNAALDLDKGERQIAPPEGDEDGISNKDAGEGDGRTPAVPGRPERSNGPAMRDRPSRSDENNFDPRARTVSAQRRPPVPGTKF
jgi:hypothetical protein